MKFIKIFIFCVILSGCSDEYREFVIPIVNGNIEKDSVLFLEGERADDFPLFAGLYTSGVDSIQVNWQSKPDPSLPYYDRDTNWSYNFDIKVDYSQDVYIQKTQGYNTFPVFIINPSKSDSLNLSSLVSYYAPSHHIYDSLAMNWFGVESYSSFSWRCSVGHGTLRMPPNTYIVLLYPKEENGSKVKMKMEYDFYMNRTVESSIFEGVFNKSDYAYYFKANGDSIIQHDRISNYYKR